MAKVSGENKPYSVHLEVKVNGQNEEHAKHRLETALTTLRSESVRFSYGIADITTVSVVPFVRHSELHYTVTREVKRYSGFTPLRNANREQAQKYLIVIVWSEGEPDLWVCDGEEGIEALREYYREDYGGVAFSYDVLTYRQAEIKEATI